MTSYKRQKLNTYTSVSTREAEAADNRFGRIKYIQPYGEAKEKDGIGRVNSNQESKLDWYSKKCSRYAWIVCIAL